MGHKPRGQTSNWAARVQNNIEPYLGQIPSQDNIANPLKEKNVQHASANTTFRPSKTWARPSPKVARLEQGVI